ncbi:MAG: hypothetical protein K8S97_03820 [Anaerolineae bacterium]|nr:hypothetical protein [Anaerolineae bacterium]
MLPENTPHSGTPQSQPQPDTDEIEPLSPEDATVILEQALEPYLTDKWHTLYRDAYSARITKSKRNLDIRVDLLGQVETQESELTPLQESGRLIAWMLLWAMLLVALTLGSALGII